MITARTLRDALRHLMVAHGALEATTRPCGTPMNTAHAHALLELLSSHCAHSITTLATSLGMERTTCSRLCQRMEDDKEILRIAHPSDGRTQLLELTAHGRALAERVDRSSALHFERVLEALPIHHQEHVITALEHLTMAMATLPPRAS